jgi:hypothetical protein
MTQPKPSPEAIKEARSVQTKKAGSGSEFTSAESVNKIALDFVRKLRKERQEK